MIEKKSPSTFDNKIVNYSHQTTIFHWNWKEKLRFVGGLVVHLQKFPPNLGRIGCVSQVINPTNLNFSFQFQWKMVVWWLQFSILLSNLLGLFFSNTTCLGQLCLTHFLADAWKLDFGVPTHPTLCTYLQLQIPKVKQLMICNHFRDSLKHTLLFVLKVHSLSY